jgi:hypothetical protein
MAALCGEHPTRLNENDVSDPGTPRDPRCAIRHAAPRAPRHVVLYTPAAHDALSRAPTLRMRGHQRRTRSPPYTSELALWEARPERW